MALVSVLLTEILLSILRNIYTKRQAAVYQHKFPASGHTGCERGGYLMATAFFRTVILYLLLIAGLTLRIGGIGVALSLIERRKGAAK